MKNQLESLNLQELQENLNRLNFAIDDLEYLLETLNEEKDELAAENSMLKQTFQSLNERNSNKVHTIKSALASGGADLKQEVKKIMSLHITPRAKKFFKSANQSPSTRMQDLTSKAIKSLKDSEILPKAKNFFTSPRRFFINKLKKQV